MQNSEQKKRLIIPGIDYSPATLSKGNSDEWRIVFYALNPQTNKLERIRKRVKKIQSIKARTQYANSIIVEINKKLQEGWNPFIEQENVNAFNLFSDCIDLFMTRIEKLVKDKSMRPDTLRAYKSYCANIHLYLKNQNLERMFIVSYNKQFILRFLDWIYYEKQNSPTTHNNYLQFLKTLGYYFLDRAFIPVNPAIGIQKLKKTEKVRILIPEDIRDIINDYLKKENTPYLCLCLMTFYCFVRRTELTKLKVKNIDFNKNVIYIGGDISKSRKEDYVTIPLEYKDLLFDHTANSESEMFIFGDENFKPSYTPVQPKKISDKWGRMRKNLKLDDRYQFYSLKDTGITEMLENGTPTLSVKSQARHHSIAMTENYVQKRSTTDTNITRNKLKF